MVEQRTENPRVTGSIPVLGIFHIKFYKNKQGSVLSFLFFFIKIGADFLKKFDVLLIIIVLILAGGLYFSGILRPSQKGAQAVAYIDGKEYKRVSLLENTTFIVEQNGHKNIVEIKDGHADMIEADCPDKLCVKQKRISLENETIVCLPNKVVIQIENAQKNTVDGIVK